MEFHRHEPSFEVGLLRDTLGKAFQWLALPSKTTESLCFIIECLIF